MSLFVVAITLGFLGSFHCIGMCGPIALSLPVHKEKPLKKLLLILSYNGGRIATYSIFGFLAGLLGQGFFAAGLQQALTIVIGSLLLISVFLPLVTKTDLNFSSRALLVLGKVKSGLSSLFLKKGFRSLALIGLLNGLLPCGLVYMGLAGAIATGDITKGMLFMAIFGLGTLPAMLVMPFAGSYIDVGFRNNIRKAVPVFITITALLLILRGLNLGIPFVSPMIEKNQAVSCHTQITPSKQNILCTGHDSQPKK